MSLEHPTTLEQFKQEAKELLLALPKLTDYDKVENGIKALNLLYLNLRYTPGKEKIEEIIAVSTWDFTCRKAVTRQTDILLTT